MSSQGASTHVTKAEGACFSTSRSEPGAWGGGAAGAWTLILCGFFGCPTPQAGFLGVAMDGFVGGILGGFGGALGGSWDLGGIWGHLGGSWGDLGGVF